MHEGEALYTFGAWDYSILLILIGVWLLLVWNRRAPSADSWRAFVNVFDSRGGNILILLAGTIYSFRAALRLFYHAIDLVVAGQLNRDDAILLMALTFVTGTVFGQFSGALMKTMHGTDPPQTITASATQNGASVSAGPGPTQPPAPSDAPTDPPPAATAGIPGISGLSPKPGG